MIIKRAQFNFYDVFDESKPGWSGHTRVRVVHDWTNGKKQPPKVFFVSGCALERIRFVEIAKSI